MTAPPHDTHLGGRRDDHDSRDVRYVPTVSNLPDSVDLRAHCGPIFDQLPLRSCGPHAITSALQLLANRLDTPIQPPSRLFIYYNARKREGTQDQDAGSTLRNGIKTIAKEGACPESAWAYDAQQVITEPPRSCYETATVHAVGYARIDQSIDHMRACLAEGYPFVFGVEIYTEPVMEAQDGGLLRLPANGDTVMGGHALLAVGYDDAAQAVIAQNSLGVRWGDNGFMYVPYAYFSEPELTYDFWTIRALDGRETSTAPAR